MKRHCGYGKNAENVAMPDFQRGGWVVIPRISRTKRIVEMARGKSVLDIGCVGMYGKGMLFKELVEVAKRVVGLDLNEEGVKLLQGEGYDVRVVNVDDAFDLGEKFDVIVAGATMEHLYNLRIFMDNVKRHLASDGIFTGTVHNPQAFERFLECWVWRRAKHIKNHTHWQSEGTLEFLFKQCDLELNGVRYIQQFATSWIGKIYDVLFWWLPFWCSRTIIFTVRHNGKV